MPQDRIEIERRMSVSTRALRTGMGGIALIACGLAGVTGLMSALRSAHVTTEISPWESWVSMAAFVATVALGLTSVAFTSALVTDDVARLGAAPASRTPRIGEEK